MASYILEKLVVSARRAPGGMDGHLHEPIAAQLGIAPEGFDYRILNKSIDSRGDPVLVYRLLIFSEAELPLPPAGPEQLARLEKAELEFPAKKPPRHPVVVGTGPAGIFGALALAMAGAEPVIVDRGFPVERRLEDRRTFLRTRVLDPDSNLLIGEGGAGAFSDGKLYTGTKDVNRRFILEQMIAGGAPPEIAYLSRPHVGSDLLPLVSKSLRERIEALGGTFLFGKEVTDLFDVDGVCRGVRCGNEVIEAPAVLLAPGLGGRLLVRHLARKAACRLKPFQTGCRIEHPQVFIDRCQYHCARRPEALGAAEYHLVSRPEATGSVSTFCMCPGGQVVNATAWERHSVSNGMSDYARGGEFANSCLITTLAPECFGSFDEAWAEFDRIEEALFLMGGSDYTLPAQDAAAFLEERPGLKNRRHACETGIVPGRIDQLLRRDVREALQAALKHFDRRYSGFCREGKLIGVESCVSSPLRFERTETGESVSMRGLFPAGEGVGGAGGILSGAADGIRCAMGILS